MRDRHRVASTLGYGPGFLHSTGQLHKGGSNSGVYLQITADDPDPPPIPGQRYSFGMLAGAQAQGDFEVLVDGPRESGAPQPVSLHPERPVDPGTAAALEHVADGQVLGLGTGRAAEAFVRGLGLLVAQGLSVRGVPTSERTAALARELDIPLLSLEEAGRIDVTFDGADEFDPNLDVIKGYGGALVREKIVAASSNKLVILAGPEKRVPVLGSRGKLPVEVLPFGEALCRTRLRELGCEPELRTGEEGRPFMTDNGNHILDCKIAPIENATELERAILAIPGSVDTGLFLGMADLVIVRDGDEAEVLTRASRG